MILQHGHFSYQRTFPIHEYGVSLQKRCMKKFFVITVVRATSGPSGPEYEDGQCYQVGMCANELLL